MGILCTIFQVWDESIYPQFEVNVVLLFDIMTNLCGCLAAGFNQGSKGVN